MKSFKEFTETQLLEQAELIDLMSEDSEPASTATDGVTNPDAQPMSKSVIKRSKVFGHPCIEVDAETFHKCIRGKQPFERWSKYVEDEALRDEMKKTFQRNKRMLMVNSRDGSMAYVK